MPEDIAAHDGRRRRCPMLGHEVAFSYCRSPASELPCRKVFDCWFRTFDVVAFLESHLTAEQIEQLRAPRVDKVVSLYELMQKARRAAEGDAADRA